MKIGDKVWIGDGIVYPATVQGFELVLCPRVEWRDGSLETIHPGQIVPGPDE